VAANDGGGRVRFLSSRTEARSDGRTPLLRVAEDAGVNAPHGCRMGICHSCDATLVAGCVRDLRTGDLAEPGARIQICVCAATGDVELDL
jgi:ferredoxin